MSSTRPLSKDGRRALLEQLAAKRQGKTAACRELEDSDDSEDESFASARSKQTATVLESDSSEEENQGPRHATSRPASTAGSRLIRLRKAGAVPLLPPKQQQHQSLATTAALEEDSDDDIAAQLGGLSIMGKAGSEPQAGGSGSLPAAPAPPARPRLDLARSQHSQPSASAEAPAGMQQDSRCLVLGERGEFVLNATASTMLYPHQVEGIKWLWSLFRLNRGGILADDMGLGKTIQCAAFLAGLIQGRLIRRAIVVAPKTLLAQWRKELGVCGLQAQAHEYGGSAGEREAALESVVRRRGVLLTTYGMVLHNAEVLARHGDHDPDDGPLWDVMICDEGHKLKNPRMQLRKALDEVPAVLRVIISGTPIQNNMMEMWALLNFCVPDVLGEAADFRDKFEKVITVGTDKHATEYERERGAVAAARLRQEIGPYMLRREKKEVFKPAAGDGAAAAAAGGAGEGSGGAAQAAAGGGGGGGSKPSSMPHKNDLIVWLKLKPMQRRVYQAFLNSDSVKKVFNQTASALAAITVLKKVCDHPALLSDRAAHGIVSGVSRARRQAAARLGGGASDGEGSECEEIEDSEEGEWESDSEDYSSEEERQRSRAKQRQKAKRAAAAARAAPAAAVGAEGEEEWSLWASADIEQRLLEEVHTTGFAASCKTVFVMALLKNLVGEGHRTLIFSQSRVMLNILESAIKEEQWRYCRIDGSVASAAEREARVRQFQTSHTIPIFLLTSQVGGLGLTLTAADRVIILDPAWNPSTDNQSVDRAYRIGQKRDVVVYRLISCGTVEENIYRRQVFKGGLSRTGMEEGEQLRYFAQQDLRDLFRLEPSECEASQTQRELHDRHAHQRRESPDLTRHLAFLRTLDCYAGVSDHDLLFSIKEREAPPASGITRPAATPPRVGSAAAAPGAGSARKQGPGRPVFGKTAAQGWSGGNELSDLFAKAVTISGGGGSAAVAAAAQPPGSSKPSPPAPAAPSPKISAAERIEELEGLLLRKRHLLTLSSGLADGGARVRSQIAELEQELAAVKAPASSSGGSAAIIASSGSGAAVAAPAVAPSRPPVPASQPARPVQLAPAARARAPAGASSTISAAAPRAGGGGNLVVAAAATQLPPNGSKAAEGPVQQPAVQPARALAPTAAAAAHTLPAAAPPAAAPGSKPAASPLFTRMRDMLWGGGSSKKLEAPGGDEAAAAGSNRPALFAGSAGGAAAGAAAAAAGDVGKKAHQASNVIDLSLDEPPAGRQVPTSQGVGQGSSGTSGRTTAAAVPAAPAAPAVTAPSGSSVPAEAPKVQRTRKEIKALLMETLQTIKAAEAGGYYERNKVEKLRRRAARLARQYEESDRGGGVGTAAI